ncbi:MAG TPA: hypothetical protein PK605_02830 [Ignavibacteria bacterium]|nr:hypothetical protein [Bacteroidota bacterium]HRE11330.1 hypothetical protein [Ignavibacteria bacterium]HRF65650.1 hypothetical protein [Ignavibacteria bacterium]HRJ03318.1 hypothetical protein [Ignavibacteria bacterium]
MKKKSLFSFIILLLVVSLPACQSGPSSSDTVEVSVGTLNDEIVKFEVNLSDGKLIDSSRKVIAGVLTGIKVPIDIETNGSNLLHVLSQGTPSINPSIRIFSDTAEGNAVPERVIDITESGFKPIGLALAERTEFLFVSYFSDIPADTVKIVRFDLSGNRTVFKIPARSIGDIEMNKDRSMLFAVDPAGSQILASRINSNFELQPVSGLISGSNTGLNKPNSIALTDNDIFVFDMRAGADIGRLFGYSLSTPGNVSPPVTLWNYCGTGKEFFTPYGIAVFESFGLKIFLTCSANRLITFRSDANGCADPLQKIDIGAPVSIAVDRVTF